MKELSGQGSDPLKIKQSEMIRIHDQSVDHFTKTNDEAKSSESNLQQRVGFDS